MTLRHDGLVELGNKFNKNNEYKYLELNKLRVFLTN